jgi:hypothetical protein
MLQKGTAMVTATQELAGLTKEVQEAAAEALRAAVLEGGPGLIIWRYQ